MFCRISLHISPQEEVKERDIRVPEKGDWSTPDIYPLSNVTLNEGKKKISDKSSIHLLA
jgi:hypothetical protein